MIEPSPTAPDGSVQRLSVYQPSHFTPGSAILCRNTAPLVAFAYSLIKRDIPCRVLGKDIGTQLASIVKKMYATTLEDLIERLNEWKTRELDRCAKEDRSPERVHDQHECLLVFINSLDENSRTISDLLARIDLLFGEAKDLDLTKLITLSTIHKAKGLEFPTVFILDFAKLQPSRFAKLPWQVQQEYNLIYVAQTRAMLNLIYINSNTWNENV